MKKELLEQLLAEGLSLEQIGERVGRHPSTVSYHLKKHGLDPVNEGRHANRGAIPREVLAPLVDRGLSLREIASEVDRSPSTVRYWVRRYGLTTRRMGLRRPELQVAREQGLRRAKSTCARHGRTDFVRENRGYYRCAKCRTEAVSAWRRRVKRRLVVAAGGACVICGYDACPAALHFHHLEPANKSFAISRQGVTRAYAEVEAEAAKCVLLCANCHAEVEDGYRALVN